MRTKIKGLRSRRANSIKGDTSRILTSPATDSDGRVWPTGTKYQPLSGGLRDSTPYASIFAQEGRVEFRFPEK